MIFYLLIAGIANHLYHFFILKCYLLWINW